MWPNDFMLLFPILLAVLRGGQGADEVCKVHGQPLCRMRLLSIPSWVGQADSHVREPFQGWTLQREGKVVCRRNDRRMNSHKAWESHGQTFGNSGREGKCYFTYAKHRLRANRVCSRSTRCCSWADAGTPGLLGPCSSDSPSQAHVHTHSRTSS